MSDIGQAGLQAGQDIIGTAASAIASNILANKATKKQKEIALWTNQNITIPNWNLQNAYNAPIAQIGRLRAAGLNPALSIGGGANIGGMATLNEAQQPGEQANYMKTADIIGNGISNIGGSISNYLLNAAQTNKLNQDTIESSERTTGIKIDNKTRDEMNKETINQIQASTHLQAKQADVEEKKLDQIDQEINESQSRVALNKANQFLTFMKTAEARQNMWAQAQQIAQGWRKLSIEQQNANTQAFLAKAQATNLEAMTELYKTQNGKAVLEKLLYDVAVSQGINPYTQEYRKVETEIENLIKQGHLIDWQANNEWKNFWNNNMTERERALFSGTFGPMIMTIDGMMKEVGLTPASETINSHGWEGWTAPYGE